MSYTLVDDNIIMLDDDDMDAYLAVPRALLTITASMVGIAGLAMREFYRVLTR